MLKNNFLGSNEDMKIRIEARYLRVLMPHIESIFVAEKKFAGIRYYKNFLMAGSNNQFGVMETPFEKSEEQIFIPYKTCKRIVEYVNFDGSFFIEKDDDGYKVSYENIIEYIDQESPIDLKTFAKKVDFENDQKLFIHLGSFEIIKKVADKLCGNCFGEHVDCKENIFCCGDAFVCRFFGVPEYTGFVASMLLSKADMSESFRDAKKAVQELLA